MLAGGGGAQIIYSAAVGRQSALHTGAVPPRCLLRLGYEPDDGCLRRAGGSLGYVPTSAAVVKTIRLIAQRVRASLPVGGRPVYKSVYKDGATTQFGGLREAAVRAGVL